MRIYCYYDQAIPLDERRTWEQEFSSFITQYAGIKPSFAGVSIDFSTYPTFVDSDGDTRPTLSYLKELNKKVEDTHGKWAYDHIFLFIYEPNFKSDTDYTKGIWGTNYSYSTGNAHLHYCRWDKDNKANTFGTAWHELSHSLDALCKVEAGVDINPLLSTTSYDAEMTHGKSIKYDYIRYKNNAGVLTVISPHLKTSYKVRMQRHLYDLKNRVTLMQRILDLKRKVAVLLNRKNGVPRK